MNPRHLYIHVPFCLRRCGYCDFAVSATRNPPIEAWLNAIEAELRGVIKTERLERTLQPTTIYIGGGTPSLMGPGTMGRLAERLRRAGVDAASVTEWTAEANPESFTPELAADWREAGVNRLSFGAQAFHAASLRWMGRLHGVEGPARALEIAASAGFDDRSIDLIFGLPARLGRDWSADLDRVLELGPEHVSLYGLTAEPATPLGRSVREGREALANDERYAAEYLLAAERLGSAGYVHYEVSNFALPGHESRHNRAYWEGAAYIGLGPGAHSYLPPRRYWNVRDWAAYRAALERGSSVREGEERIDAGAALLERAWLGLRTTAGVALETDAHRRLADIWKREGWAKPGDDRLRLTPRGWLLLDRLAVELDAAVA